MRLISASLSMAERNCARWRRESVPVWLIKKTAVMPLPGLREQQMSGRGNYVPLVFQPGEAVQFDWSEDWAVIGGKRTKLQLAHSAALAR